MASEPTGETFPDTASTSTPAPPRPVPAEPSPPPPAFRLYRPSAVTLATLLGSPIAGLIVLSINYRRLGRRRAAWLALATIPLFCVLMVAFALVMPDDLPRPVTFAPGIVFLAVMMVAADTLQGRAVKQHRRRGGPVASLWKAAGIAIVTMAALFAIVAALFLLAGGGETEHTLQYSPREKVYYRLRTCNTDAYSLSDGTPSASAVFSNATFTKRSAKHSIDSTSFSAKASAS